MAQNLMTEFKQDEAMVYYMKALGYRLGGVNYCGETIGNEPAFLKAHGLGILEYENGQTVKG